MCGNSASAADKAAAATSATATTTASAASATTCTAPVHNTFSVSLIRTSLFLFCVVHPCAWFVIGYRLLASLMYERRLYLTFLPTTPQKAENAAVQSTALLFFV